MSFRRNQGFVSTLRQNVGRVRRNPGSGEAWLRQECFTLDHVRHKKPAMTQVCGFGSFPPRTPRPAWRITHGPCRCGAERTRGSGSPSLRRAIEDSTGSGALRQSHRARPGHGRLCTWPRLRGGRCGSTSPVGNSSGVCVPRWRRRYRENWRSLPPCTGFWMNCINPS